ncbi:MAG TPA: hypothetical protein VLV83_14950, partial [Acidobacteriota bacterium]|nr:hypothetical protein [Acidobacteriota bacterium]
MSRKFTRKRPPRWANEVVVEVLSDPRNWKLTTGGDKKNFLSLWIALPGTMNDWTHMEAVAFEERAEKLYEQLESEGQERFIIRGRILGKRDGWNPRILIRSIEPIREVGAGEISFEELADYGEERESLLSQ